MAIRYYDEALVNKIKKWLPEESNLMILKPDETKRLFSLKADIGNDKPIKLPLIAISRDPTITISNTNKQIKTFDGLHLDANKKSTMQFNAIPLELSYQIDIYTKRFEECDEYLRNFIFNFVNYPKLEILIPYNNVNIKHVSNIILSDSAVDNSDIPEKLFSDQFTRWTLSLKINDAYIFSIPINSNYTIDTELDIIDDNGDKITEEPILMK